MTVNKTDNNHEDSSRIAVVVDTLSLQVEKTVHKLENQPGFKPEWALWKSVWDQATTEDGMRSALHMLLYSVTVKKNKGEAYLNCFHLVNAVKDSASLDKNTRTSAQAFSFVYMLEIANDNYKLIFKTFEKLMSLEEWFTQYQEEKLYEEIHECYMSKLIELAEYDAYLILYKHIRSEATQNALNDKLRLVGTDGRALVELLALSHATLNGKSLNNILAILNPNLEQASIVDLIQSFDFRHPVNLVNQLDQLISKRLQNMAVTSYDMFTKVIKSPLLKRSVIDEDVKLASFFCDLVASLFTQYAFDKEFIESANSILDTHIKSLDSQNAMTEDQERLLEKQKLKLKKLKRLLVNKEKDTPWDKMIHAVKDIFTGNLFASR